VKLGSYTALARRDDDGTWIVRLKEEPRCHTYGRTPIAAINNLREAMGAWDIEDAETAAIGFFVERAGETP
jgi:predicted RNase H-like HicB family nuclease